MEQMAWRGLSDGVSSSASVYAALESPNPSSDVRSAGHDHENLHPTELGRLLSYLAQFVKSFSGFLLCNLPVTCYRELRRGDRPTSMLADTRDFLTSLPFRTSSGRPEHRWF